MKALSPRATCTASRAQQRASCGRAGPHAARAQLHAALRRTVAPSRRWAAAQPLVRDGLQHRALGVVHAAAAEPAPPATSTTALDWRASWWPVAFLTDLDASTPVPFTLLGEDIVLWRDGDGEWRAFADRCPHRLAPLSEGRVNAEGQLECPYHGWAFDGASGACASMPQEKVPGGPASQSGRACATNYATAVAQGMLFVLPQSKLPADAPLPPLPTVPELDDPAYVCIDIARDLPYDYSSLLENVLDVAHVPFVHHLTVSNRANAGPVELEVCPPGVTSAGFEGLWAEGPRRGKLGPQRTRFIAPSLMYHSLSAPSLGTTLTVVYAVPSAPGRVRLMARFPFRFNAALPRLVIKLAPRWVQHIGQNGVLEDDQVLLHKQERFLEADATGGKTYAQSCFMPLPMDAYVLAFRSWLTRFGGGAPAWPAGASAALPPLVEVREALLDRYNSHTRNCTSCMRALSGVRLARTVAIAVGVVAALAASGCLAAAAFMTSGAAVQIPLRAAAAAAGVVLLSLFATVRLNTLEEAFYTGPYPPKRNRADRKKLIARSAPKNSGQSIKLV